MIGDDVRFGDDLQHILTADPELLEGDRALAAEELGIRKHAFRHQTDLILPWFRLFRLHFQGLSNLRTEGRQVEPELHVSHQLWVHLLSYAVGSARLSFESAISGYYAQSYTMTRSVFEAFLIWKFTERFPDHAKRWFIGESGEPPNPWRTPKIIDKLHGGDDPLVEAVIGTYHRIKSMAHPSENVLQQSVTFDEGVFQIGPNYIPDQSTSTLYEGARAFSFVLRLLDVLGTQPSEWKATLDEVGDDLSRAQLRHGERIREFGSRSNRGDEWIVQRREEDDVQ